MTRIPHNLKGISFKKDGIRHFITGQYNIWNRCVTNSNPGHTTFWNKTKLRKFLRENEFRTDLKLKNI